MLVTGNPHALSESAAASMKVHPAALIFLWACLSVALQSLNPVTLLLAGLPLLLAASLLSFPRLRILLRRTRWILLSLLLIYAWATPGAAVWPGLEQYSPTREGLADGLMQMGRLVFMLAGLAVLLDLLPQRQLIAGLYVLAYPLRFFGMSRERLAVRLALTLYYAETAMLDTSAGWREEIGKMLEPVENAQDSIELHTMPFSSRDGLLVILAIATLAWVWS